MDNVIVISNIQNNDFLWKIGNNGRGFDFIRSYIRFVWHFGVKCFFFLLRAQILIEVRTWCLLSSQKCSSQFIGIRNCYLQFSEVSSVTRFLCFYCWRFFFRRRARGYDDCWIKTNKKFWGENNSIFKIFKLR